MDNKPADLIIRNGTVIDGTGAARNASDVAIKDDRIVAVGRLGSMKAGREIDATGRIVTPGFIDAHTHDDRALLSMPDMTPKVSQGVTSLVAGNCGVSLAPLVIAGRPPPPLDLLGPDPGWFRFPRFRDFRQALGEEPPALNCALLVGHITLRHRAMDRFDRPATLDEIDVMRALVEQSMGDGAIGFSTGLDYPDAVASSREEVRHLVAAVKPFGGLYCSHTRNYFEAVEEALDEALELGEETGVPVVISHHQVSGLANFGKSRRTLARIERARASHAVGLDAYPYNASSKTLDPGRAKPGVRIMVTWSISHPEHVGRELADIAAEWNCTPVEAAERLLPAGAIYFQLDEEDVRRILAYPHTMIGSDGLPHDVHPHPRLWGAFPRVLGHYAREVGLMTLEEAVRRMTSLPAAWFGLPDRGVLRPGAYADIVVFDPETVADRGTFIKPAQPAAGIDTVIVNGRPVWSQGAHTGARPGRVLRRDPSVANIKAG
ncbi:MAG: D-aminoacylase [Alphaproteobacteria bacterium]|nr:D-aminoacylase [Alphaproteobacteria bacterium]